MVEWLHALFPLVCHLCMGDGIDSSLNRGSVEIVFADSSRIQQATHVADLMCMLLEGADSAADEDPEKVVRAKFVL